MSSIKFRLENFFDNPDEILKITNLVKVIKDCGNDELIIETSSLNFLDLEIIKFLICYILITDKNKTVKFVETVRFENLPWKQNEVKNGQSI